MRDTESNEMKQNRRIIAYILLWRCYMPTQNERCTSTVYTLHARIRSKKGNYIDYIFHILFYFFWGRLLAYPPSLSSPCHTVGWIVRCCCCVFFLFVCMKAFWFSLILLNNFCPDCNVCVCRCCCWLFILSAHSHALLFGCIYKCSGSVATTFVTVCVYVVV